MAYPATLSPSSSQESLPGARDLGAASPALVFTEEEIRNELRRVVASEDFPATVRNRKVLTYVVERALQHEAGPRRITAFDIATNIFGRRDSFNPVEDPIVRIEAARLRKDLETYYLKSGRSNPLRIEIPRGGYDAVFVRSADSEEIAPEIPPVTGDLARDGIAQLRRIMASPDFPATPRNRRFLAYIVEKEIAGLANEISARSIGKTVFDRGSTFDPNKDPIVRIEAGKLRRDMEVYYLKCGRRDPLLISIPKGRYRPIFSYRT